MQITLTNQPQIHHRSRKHKSKRHKSKHQKTIANTTTSASQLRTSQLQDQNFRYFRYATLKIKHIQRDWLDEQEPRAQPTQSAQPQDDKVQSFRYFRYKKLSIRHIEKDWQEKVQQICYEPQTCMQMSFNQPPIQHLLEESNGIKVSKCQQDKSKNAIQESQPGINFRWQFRRDKYLSQKCIEKLMTQKSEIYDKMLIFFKANLKNQSKKNKLYIYGDKQTGKKTLLQQALNSNLFTCQTFYLNFSAPHQKYKEQILTLFKKLKSDCRMQAKEQQEIKSVLVVNNVKIFIYFLKKAHIYHQFKIFMKNSSLILVLIDRLPLDSKQFSWLAENSQTLHVPKNSKDLFLSCLVDYFADFRSLNGEIVLARPLANYFTVKLYEEDCLQFGIIQKFAQFISSPHGPTELKQVNQHKQKQATTIKVTRQLIQSFKKSSFQNKCIVQLEHLNLHQKLILIACFIYLTENERIAIPIPQIQKNYKWACMSLSIQPKSTKQLLRDTIHNLQTYRLVKLLDQFGKSKQKHIVLSIDLQKIKDGLQGEAFLHKFFTIKRDQQE